MKTEIFILLSFLLFTFFSGFSQKEIETGSPEFYDILIQKYQQKKIAFENNEEELLNISKNIKILEAAKLKAQQTRK